ncbi:MoaD/ThiS family protein [Aquiflexum sp. LQ15W]|uniref:MoaD/ThiS family protein n=1 Tax=Cognataquiflexum nitidum TaxID=2922272 RepID=UPI001F12CF5C|nr:MoaD/ThiS family protein [Cognataquiflexum nitidum]MCH6200708.1 MoaD/ThiS family protein [Cognataquiflexum nitidum]
MTPTSIHVIAFGMIAEKIKTKELVLEYMPDTEVLLGYLYQQYPELQHTKFGIAVNKKMAVGKTVIPIGAEVALLPPFSGG